MLQSTFSTVGSASFLNTMPFIKCHLHIAYSYILANLIYAKCLSYQYFTIPEDDSMEIKHQFITSRIIKAHELFFYFVNSKFHFFIFLRFQHHDIFSPSLVLTLICGNILKSVLCNWLILKPCLFFFTSDIVWGYISFLKIHK